MIRQTARHAHCLPLLKLVNMNNRQKISLLARKLQSQTQVPLWSIANEKVIYALAVGQKIPFGPRTQRLAAIMKLAYRMRLSDMCIFLIGFLHVCLLWFRLKKQTAVTPMPIKRIFAGFGASSEEYLYADYLRQSIQPAVRINWVSLDGMNHIGCPSLLSIIRELWQHAIGQTAKIKRAIPDIAEHPIVYLTVCAVNIGMYAMFRPFWRLAKSRGVDEATFLVLDMPAFAAIDEGIHTIYLQHGLMKFNILVPKLDRMDVLTPIEEAYFRQAAPHTIVKRMREPVECKSTPKNHVLMVMSLNVKHEHRLQQCQSLVQWAEKSGMTIVIRPTRVVNPAELAVLSQYMPQAVIDDYTLSLEESFNKWQPKVVSAWSSTGLATALDYGCLPVSLYHPDDDEIWDEMIYPMHRKVLFWPRDALLLDKSVQSESDYVMQIQALDGYQECVA